MFLGRKSCVLFFQILLLHKIEGLLLKRGSELTAQSFILVCDLQGTAWTKTLIFTYNGNSAGGCTSPPSPSCGSILGTVTWDNATVNLTLHQNKILDVGTALWDCSHGAEKSFLNTTVIALCMNGKISFEDKIAVSCSCGFPSVEADVEYKDSKDGKLIGKQTFVLGSSSDSRCSSDNRSMDFSSYIENYPSKTKEVCATIQTFSQISTPDKICAGLTTPSSTINSDMSTTVLESSSTFSSDMPTTVSEAPLPPITTSSAGLSQEKVIAIIISSALAPCALILMVVLVVRQCRRKNKGTPAKKKENHFANKQNNLTKKDDLKSYKPKKSKLSEKRNTKLGSTSLDKKKDAQLEIFACKDRMYQHYPQTTDCWNNYGNQPVFNNSHNERNMMFCGNRHDNYFRPHTRPNNRMLSQSHYPQYQGHNEEMFQYYRADYLYRGQQMYQRPYVALYDMHIIDNKQDDKRSSKGRPYEKNWDLLY